MKRIKTKQLLFLASFFAMGIQCSYAQEDDRLKERYISHERALHAEDTAVVRGSHGVGWVRSYLLDEWFLQLQGGGQLYYGTDDRLGPLSDRLTANTEFQFGRRIFPMFGFRVGIGYGSSAGFLSKDNYANHNISGGDGEHGDGLSGYYWDYNDDLYIQRWKQVYYGADLFLDLAILRGNNKYNPYKRWSNIVYAGVHTKYALSELDEKNHRSELHIGYILARNITPRLHIYADVRASAVERLFDREWIPTIESSGFGIDKILNIHAGITYKFRFRDDDARDAFVHRNTKVQTENVSTYSTYVYHSEEIKRTKLIDTLLVMQEFPYRSPELQDKIDSLRALIDADRKGLADDTPLDSILLNQLLPYEMVFFELDKWDILPAEETKIAKMAVIMKAFPDEKFLLAGSADSKTGTPRRNDFLSHNRADVVYNLLISQYGVNPDQLDREYLGGILDYDPYILNRTTVIIMKHPAVEKSFNEMKAKRQAGGGQVEINK